MISVKGSADFSIPSIRILAFIRDPSRFAGCIPNLEKFEIKDENKFEALFKLELPSSIAVSYLRNITVKMNFELLEMQHQIFLKGEGRSAGVKITVSITMSVSGDASSHLKWVATLDAGLIEKLLGKTRLETVATTISTQIVNCIPSKLAA
ncbi:MAG: SRPBCC domain-containing protein [Nitrososphaerota archaeon]